MKALADVAIALADLVEAEGRSLRGSMIKIVIGVILVMAGGLAILGSLAMLIWSLYLFLLQLGLGAALAALLDAAAVLSIGGGMIWGAIRLNR